MLVVVDKAVATQARAHAWAAFQEQGQPSPIWRSWRDNLRYLRRYACRTEQGFDPTRVVVTLGRDGAPLSFSLNWWERKDLSQVLSRAEIRALLDAKNWDQFLRHYRHWFTGGLIYHGTHDLYGAGIAPTFSVSLGRTEPGWEIHT